MKDDFDAPKDIIQFTFKTKKLMKKSILDAIKWIIENGKNQKNFKELNGEIKISSLIKNSNTVKFIESDLNINDVKLIKKEFKKYAIQFAVDKIDNNTFKIAFAGKDSNKIEYALKKVLEREEKKVDKINIKKIKNQYKEYMRNREEKNTDRNKEHERGER